MLDPACCVIGANWLPTQFRAKAAGELELLKITDFRDGGGTLYTVGAATRLRELSLV